MKTYTRHYACPRTQSLGSHVSDLYFRDLIDLPYKAGDSRACVNPAKRRTSLFLCISVSNLLKFYDFLCANSGN